MSYSYQSSSSSMSSSGGGGLSMGGGGLSMGGGGISGGTTYISSSSSSGGAGGAIHGGGVGLSAGGGGAGGTGVSFARKTNIRSSGASAGANASSMMMALSAMTGGTASYAGTHGELGGNPKAVILRRDREKHDINDLNVKLAEYIEQNGWYRIKVKEQEKLIIKMKGEFESIEARLRQIYDVEMANLRGTIDATAREKAAVELKVDTLEALYKEFKAKYETELSSHESTRLRLPKLEKEISEKDAQIDFLAKTLSSLEPQVSALKAQISTYQKESIEAKMGMEGEVVQRVELESKLVTKQEEIDFLKRVYEEKLAMALDFDIDTDAAYSNDLALALRDIKAEYQAQLEAVGGNQNNAWFQEKMNTMMQTSQKQGQELMMAKEETVRMKTRYNESISSVGTFKAKIASLEAAMAEMTADRESMMQLHAVALADRDQQIVEYKRQIAAHILELKSFMDAKLSLDEEIAVYRRLLLAGGSGGAAMAVGGGGASLSISGGSSSTVISGGSSSSTVISGGGSSTVISGGGATVVGGGGSAVSGGGSAGMVTVVGGGGSAGMMTVGGGGVTSEVVTAGSSTSISQATAKTTFSTMNKGRGAIAETALDGQFIIVENKSAAALDLGGWSLERSVDNGALIIYAFPAGTSIAAGGFLKIWSSGVAGASSAAGNLIMAGGQTWTGGYNAITELKFNGVVEAKLTQTTSLA